MSMMTAADLKLGDVFADDFGEDANIYQLRDLSPGAASVYVIRAHCYQGRTMRISRSTFVAEVLEHSPLDEEVATMEVFGLSCLGDFERMITYV
jgi:hypothetical protein